MAMATTGSWHWRETLDPEQAYRRQLLKVGADIPLLTLLLARRQIT